MSPLTCPLIPVTCHLSPDHQYAQQQHSMDIATSRLNRPRGRFSENVLSYTLSPSHVVSLMPLLLYIIEMVYYIVKDLSNIIMVHFYHFSLAPLL